MLSARCEPRSRRAELMSRTRHAAIWPAMSKPRRRERLTRWPNAEISSFSAEFTSAFEACRAGVRPKATPAAQEINKVYAKMRVSGVISRAMEPQNEGRAEEISMINRWRAHPARGRPTAPARRPSRMLSVSNWRSKRQRLAPRARRTAISLRRATARASKRLATLAQAIRRSNATADMAARTTGQASESREERLLRAEAMLTLVLRSASG